MHNKNVLISDILFLDEKVSGTEINGGLECGLERESEGRRVVADRANTWQSLGDRVFRVISLKPTAGSDGALD